MKLYVMIAAVLLAFTVIAAEPRREELTPAEIDQLRDSAQEPDLRLKLYIKFSRERLDAVEQARTDAKVTNHGQQMHERLQDFLDLYDELNENVDTFADRKADIRKVLKAVIEADTEFQAKLRALRDASGTNPEDAKQYEFLLSNALDTLDSSVQDHRQLLTEQEEAAKHKKLIKQQ
jgi:hypothetical protein